MVELALRDAVVHVHRREEELALLLELVEAVHAGRRLLRDALHPRRRLAEPMRPLLQRRSDRGEEGLLLGALGIRDHGRIGLRHRAEMEEERRVASVVHDEVGALAVRPRHRLLRAPPVLLQRLALPREHGDARLRDRRRRRVVRREDVAARPTHVRAQFPQRLDEDGRLHRHVERTHDAGAGQRLLRAVLRPYGHETGHLVLFERDHAAAEVRQLNVFYFMVHRSRYYTTNSRAAKAR